MPRCRCHSGRQAHRCCEPLHAGKPAPTPEALMRSRYAAYARALVDYLIDTTAPGPALRPDREAWAAEIAAFCGATRFTGLEIRDAPEPVGDEGFVTFRAGLTRHGRDASFTERSRFVRIDGRWLYHGAVAGPSSGQ